MSDKIECTIEQVVNAREALQRLASAQMPLRAAYHVSRVLKFADAVVRSQQKRRFRTIEEFGEAREATLQELLNGAKKTVYDVKPERMPEFSDAIEKQMSEQAHVPWKKIPIESLSPFISPGDVAVLEPFISGEMPPLGEEEKP